jgi:hypothetical protein
VQPFALASAAFSSEPTVPIIVTPSARAHWHATNATSGGVKQNRLAALQRKSLPKQILDRQALSISVAATSSLTPAGIGTRRSAAMIRSVL